MCEKVLIPEVYVNKSSPWQCQEIHNLRNWETVKKIFGLFSDEWIFRGQRSSDWGLTPSILPRKPGETAYADRFSLEFFVVEEVKNRYLQRTIRNDLPKTNLNWLAFIQHYGGKTRLLDFTTDPYIASFFAFGLDRKVDRETANECAVWAVNKRWCVKKAQIKIQNNFRKLRNFKIDNFASFFDEMINTDNFFPMVCPFVADWEDERIKNQKSVFFVSMRSNKIFRRQFMH